MCGVVGYFSLNQDVQASNFIYDGILSLQHRGQDAAGIATFDGSFHLIKGLGLVRELFNETNIQRLKGSLGIGHTRYSTMGLGVPEDAQPFITQYPYGIAMSHNGQVVNFRELRHKLRNESKWHINSGCDVEIILAVFADELAKSGCIISELSFEHIIKAAQGVFARVKGAYSVVGIIARKGMFAFRDPKGIRPLIFAKDETEKRFMFASESVACDIAGFKTYEDVQPGEVIFIDYQGNINKKTVADDAENCPCIFEYIYFARPESTINGISVYKTRLNLGRYLAESLQKSNIPDKIDVIIPVPDTSRAAATEMARVLGLKYREGLVKNRYIGRTFIMPGINAERRKAVRQKLNPIKREFENKNVLIIDDSIVRGNTITEIVKIAREMGAKKVFVAIHSAPLISPCFYGIDMSRKGEFIALNNSQDVEKIKLEIGADYLIYQSVDEMIKSAHSGNKSIKKFCTACFTKIYPTGDITEETFAEFQKDRDDAVQLKTAK